MRPLPKLVMFLLPLFRVRSYTGAEPTCSRWRAFRSEVLALVMVRVTELPDWESMAARASPSKGISPADSLMVRPSTSLREDLAASAISPMASAGSFTVLMVLLRPLKSISTMPVRTSSPITFSILSRSISVTVAVLPDTVASTRMED